MGYTAKARSQRQQVIDEYLRKARKKSFVPGEFLTWLQRQPDHPVYEIFFGMSDAEAALEHRKEMVRKWASGLRLTVVTEEIEPRRNAIRVSEFTVPAMHSPVGSRRGGGGYIVTDVNDPAHMAELRAQAATALESWLERHGGVAEASGCNLAPVREIVGELRGARVSEAA